MGLLGDLRNTVMGFEHAPRCEDVPRIDNGKVVRLLRGVYERWPTPFVLQAIIYGAGVESLNYMLEIYREILAEPTVDERVAEAKLAQWKRAAEQLRDQGLRDVAEVRATINVWGDSYDMWPEWLRQDILGENGVYDRWFVSGGEHLQFPMLNYPWMLYNQLCAYYNWREEGGTILRNVTAEAFSDSASQLAEGVDIKEGYEQVADAMEDIAKEIGEGTAKVVSAAVTGVAKGAARGAPFLAIAAVAGGAYFLITKFKGGGA